MSKKQHKKPGPKKGTTLKWRKRRKAGTVPPPEPKEPVERGKLYYVHDDEDVFYFAKTNRGKRMHLCRPLGDRTLCNRATPQLRMNMYDYVSVLCPNCQRIASRSAGFRIVEYQVRNYRRQAS